MPPTGETPRIIAGRYTIERVLGRGATANVYLARDAETGDEVAVKVLLPEIAHGIGIARFLREIRLTSPFNHPNIVGIRDSGIAEDDLPFFVMPYMEGGSLRERLARDSQLPLSEAARITQDVAAALAHAHSMGLIHRDVKPENILFSGGRAMVSDFGIARAIAGSENISGTTPGVIRGTPAYMSPEQASGEADLDSRSDVYSLACVSYEMIAGLPPFVGPNARNVMAQRMTRDALAIQTYRSSAPAAISDVMKRAMAVDPADRESDPREFARQLTEGIALSQPTATRTETRNRSKRRARLIAIGGAVAAAGLLAWVATAGIDRLVQNGGQLDSSRMAFAALLPPEVHGTRLENVLRGMTEAASAWTDVRTQKVDLPRGELNHARVTGSEQARRLGVRWLVVLQPVGAADTVVDAVLFDASSGREVRRVRGIIPSDPERFSDACRALLARAFGASDTESRERNLGVSFTAWREYVDGLGQAERWQLDSAEHSFSQALQPTQSFPRAALELAQIETWRRRPIRSPEQTTLIRALERPGTLAVGDSLRVRGVLAMSGNDFPTACSAYNALKQHDSLSVAAWIGLGDCRIRDKVVVRDVRSPSGFRFRSSYQSGIAAYKRAAELAPESTKLFCPLDGSCVLIVSTNRIVLGEALAPDTAKFAAYPAADLRADTVLFVPYPLGALSSSHRPRISHEDEAHERIIANHRTLLAGLAAGWARAMPSDPDAHETLSTALELLGDISPSSDETASAITALEVARRLATDGRQRFRLAVAAIRLDLKSGNLVGARDRADSLLHSADDASKGSTPESSRASALASLAALIGREEALRHWLYIAGSSSDAGMSNESVVPQQVRREVAALIATVVLERCDSVAATIARSEDALTRFVSPAEHDAAWSATMPRWLSLATPCDSGRGVLRVSDATDRLMLTQQAFARADYRGVRAQIDTLDRFRGAARPGDVSLDYTVQESWLLAAAGDSVRALARLRRTIEALPTLGRDVLDVVEQAAAVCNALELASNLASRLHDPADASAWFRKHEDLCPDVSRPAVNHHRTGGSI